ncbi:MAG: hypothetical protein HUJ75_03375 [Parasporobacterium sp.]|nr:hypothetical protein [Parasporobacterium sp.]
MGIHSKRINPCEELANAIIVQAAKDYRSVLKVLKKNPSSIILLDKRKELEGFFTGDWFSKLSEADGKYIMEELKKEAGYER